MEGSSEAPYGNSNPILRGLEYGSIKLIASQSAEAIAYSFLHHLTTNQVTPAQIQDRLNAIASTVYTDMFGKAFVVTKSKSKTTSESSVSMMVSCFNNDSFWKPVAVPRSPQFYGTEVYSIPYRGCEIYRYAESHYFACITKGDELYTMPPADFDEAMRNVIIANMMPYR